MKAIVRQTYGGPEQLIVCEAPKPEPRLDDVVVRVRAFGLNRAELYFRSGHWGEANPISGIECVGEVDSELRGEFPRGQKVIALMGGMGRTIPGSYAEFTRVPRSNVIALSDDQGLSWEELAAIPESYATAWSCLHGNLALRSGDTLLIRGAASALGQAAINIAAHAGARVMATTRSPSKFDLLESLGARHVSLEAPQLSEVIRSENPRGIDAVLDLVGNSTVLDSLKAVRRGGRVCIAGFLGGGDPIAQFQPLTELPSGAHLSFFGSAFVFGSADYPLTEIPFADFIERSASGVYQARPAHVFAFDDIQEAHRLMESNAATGKVVVTA